MFVITIDSLKYRLFFLALFLWHGARDWESQIQVQLIVRKMPSHWAPSEIEPKVPCGTVRESNLGPLCAIPTTLTIQPLRRTKVWPGNQPYVLQSQNLPPYGSRNSDSQFSVTFPDWLKSWTVIEPGFKSRWVEKGWWTFSMQWSRYFPNNNDRH